MLKHVLETHFNRYFVAVKTNEDIFMNEKCKVTVCFNYIKCVNVTYRPLHLTFHQENMSVEIGAILSSPKPKAHR